MKKTLPGSVINPAKYEPVEYGLGGLATNARPLTYLACPYSHASPQVEEWRFEQCTKAAAWLIQEKGLNVFSPITHSHPLRKIGGCRGDFSFWEKIDREYIGVSRLLVVLLLAGWKESVGVQKEIRIARQQGIPVQYLITGESTGEQEYYFVDSPEVWEPFDIPIGEPVNCAEPAKSTTAVEVPVDYKNWPELKPDVKGCPELKPISTNMPTQVPEGMDNPKDLIGMTKPPLRLVPGAALLYLAKVMQHGAQKYGPYNWRQKAVRYTVYLEAALRHILAALDGEELDPESKQPHTAHAGACMAIILDAKSIGKLIDDRPTPGATGKLITEMTESKLSKETCDRINRLIEGKAGQ